MLMNRETRVRAYLYSLAELLRRLIEEVLYHPAPVFDKRSCRERFSALGIHSGHLHRELSCERAEVWVLGNEVGLTREQDHRTYPPIMGIAPHDTSPEFAPSFLEGRGPCALAQERRGGLKIASGLLECLSALHDRDASTVSELLDTVGS